MVDQPCEKSKILSWLMPGHIKRSLFAPASIFKDSSSAAEQCLVNRTLEEVI